MTHRKRKYDIFLSYRRDGGAETAKHLRDTLTERGYSVFLDVESLRAGAFNTELYRVIEQCTDFLLILPKKGLDRCADEKPRGSDPLCANSMLELLKKFDSLRIYRLH